MVLRRVFPQIPNYSILNPEAFIHGTRKAFGKDLNRQFGKNNVTANNILQIILSHRPQILITLHEDDEIDNCYVYCTDVLKPLAEQSLNVMRTILPGIPNIVHGDTAEQGVITHGKEPFKGTLEKEVVKYGINYICFEAPELNTLSERIKALTHGATYFIKHLK